MADRQVEIRYATTGVARATGSVRAIAAAHANAAKTITAAQARVASASRAVASVAAVAGKIILFGVGAALAVGAKAAIDFESSMAGVFKTLGDTASVSEIIALGEALRAMSLDIPVNVNELAFIAELGGQLGVGIEDMEHFTKTIAALATTTNLSSADAAKGLARFSNILQLPISDVDDLGNIIVELGNNFATTESEILNFGLRLAPIGKTVGATADEIFGIAAAFSSLGIPAERGGTAVQRTFIEIEKAVDSGGRELENFADIAGMTAAEFSNLSAVGRFEAFVNGLGDIGEAGESVFQALDKVNISQQRSIQVLLAAAGAGDLFSEALKSGNDALEDGDALWEEAARRWGTSASQIQILVNTFNDLRIEIGQGVVPMLNRIIGFFRDLITAMKDNIGMLKVFAGVLLTLVVFKGLIGLGNALSAAIVSFKEFRAAMVIANKASGSIMATIGATTAALSVLTIGLFAVVAAFGAYFFWQAKSAKKTRELRDAANALNDELDRGVPAIDAWSDFLATKFADNTDAIDYLNELGISSKQLAVSLADGDIDSMRERILSLSDAQIEARKALAEGGGAGRIGVGSDIRRMNAGREAAMELLNGLVEESASVVEESERRKRDAMQSTEFLREGRGRIFLPRDLGGDDIAQDPLDAFLSSSDDNFDAYNTYKDNVNEAMDDMVGNMRDHFNDVRDTLMGSIDIWGEYEGAATVEVDKILKNLADQAVDIAEWNNTLATLVAMGVSANVIDVFNQADLATRAGITKLLKDSPAEFLKLVEGFEENFASFEASAIVQAQLFTPVMKQMSMFVDSMLAEAMKLEGGAAGFEAYKQSVLEKLGELGPEARQALINTIDSDLSAGLYTEMFGVSEDMLRGLRDGLLTWRSVLGGALGGLRDGIVGQLKGEFEIRSPSKVFEQIGEQLAAGLGVGLTSGIDLRAIDNHVGSFRQAAMGQARMPVSQSEVTNTQSTTVVINGSRHGDLRSDITAGLIAGGVTRQVETLVR